MRSDYPYGVYLSGGIDSACILALCAQESSVVPDSFSVAFSQEEYNEALIATKIATHFTSKHHIIPVSQEDILYNLENSVWYGESLAINGQLPAKYLLSKYVQQQNIRVILSGEGADEALLGYPHFKLDLLEHEPHAHPEIVALFHQENSLTKGVFVPTNSHTQHMHLPNFLRSKLEFGWQLQRWMHGDAIHSRETIAKYDPVHHVSAMLPPIHPVYRANYLWIKLALHSYILRGIGDGMEMAHSIEGRPPFLDHEFFAYATSLPIDAKIHRGREKYILREAMSGLLPEWIRNKPKHPFIAPPILPSMLFSTTTKKSSGVEFIQDTLRSRHVDNIPYMDSNKIREFLDKEIHRPELWTNNLDAAVMLLLSATLLEKRWKEERFGQQAI
jgi:asparagine synthase (glutamine-hydrolysing)